ncbi:type VI secretion system protein IglI family protein [Sorangium sp. So ce854]|uniref:type VI secretion system protein IglI family protein n=1 Tax=Sorangium sp. So ce854 TaxID=3133322 RepID=UPI003F644F03
MARDLSLFLQPIEPAAEPGLDATDARLDELVELSGRGRHDEVAARVEALAREGVHDIRALSFYLFAVFREGGLAALGPLFEVVSLALGPNFEAIGPARRRKDHVDRRLAWLFQTIADELEYHEKSPSPAWDALHEGLAEGALGEALAGAERVARALAEGAYGPAVQQLGRLAAWLRRRAEELASRPAPEPPRPAEGRAPAAGAPPAERAATAADAVPADAVPAAPAPAAAVGSSDPLRARVELTASHHFLELVAKLRAFEALVDKRDFAKAAVVADDLQRTLEGFDPRVYFPELFSNYSALLSAHIALLAEHLDDRDSLSRKALEQFYRVDLKRFSGG